MDLSKNYLRPISIVLTCLLIFGNSFSQSVFEKYEKKNIQNNRVRSKTQFVHEYSNGKFSASGYMSFVTKYDKSGNILEEISYRASGQISYKRNYEYDSKGNLIEYQNFDGSRNKITYKKLIKYNETGGKMIEAGFDGVDRFNNKYGYDENGRIKEIKYYISNNLIEKRKIIYDGRKQKIIVYKPNNTITEVQEKKYDFNGNLIEDILYSSLGKENRRISYKYDNKGNLIEESKFYSGNLSITTKNIYGSNNSLLEVINLEPDGNSYSANKYSYDSTGKLLEESWFDKMTKKYSNKKYKYDSRGNFKEVYCYYAPYNFNEYLKFTYDFY